MSIFFPPTTSDVDDVTHSLLIFIFSPPIHFFSLRVAAARCLSVSLYPQCIRVCRTTGEIFASSTEVSADLPLARHLLMRFVRQRPFGPMTFCPRCICRSSSSHRRPR